MGHHLRLIDMQLIRFIISMISHFTFPIVFVLSPFISISCDLSLFCCYIFVATNQSDNNVHEDIKELKSYKGI